VSHPAGLPDLFIDRSLGRKKVPSILRAAGLRLETLAEVYGMPRDQDVDDVTWIGYTAANDRVALMKDAAIAEPGSLEAAAVRSTGARCFTLTRQDLPAHRMAVTPRVVV
jgi:hypothetical protein